MKTLLLLLLLAVGLRAEDVNVTLAWDANPEGDIDHYVLRIGTAPGVYTQAVNVTGTQRSILLPAGTLYYAVVTAVNTSALESPASVELVFQAFKAGEGKAPSAPVGLRKPAALQARLEMSTDLQAWAVVFSQSYSGAEAAAFWRVNLEAK